MTNKEKIKYLSQYVNVAKEYDEAHEAYIRYRNRISTTQSQRLSDMPRAQSTAKDKMAGHMAMLEKLEEIVDERLEKLEQIRIDIENVIGRLEDSNHRRLLMLRYIEGMRWEELAVIMSYSWRHTHRVHSNALNKINLGGNQNG